MYFIVQKTVVHIIVAKKDNVQRLQFCQQQAIGHKKIQTAFTPLTIIVQSSIFRDFLPAL